MKESENIEKLRCILSRQHSKEISTEEACDIGESLITLFEILADYSEHEAIKSGPEIATYTGI